MSNIQIHWRNRQQSPVSCVSYRAVGHRIQAFCLAYMDSRSDITPQNRMDTTTPSYRLKRTITGVSDFVLRVHPLASLMCTRARACKRIAVGGRTRRTKNETAVIDSFRPSIVVELSIGEYPGGRTRRTKHGLC